MLGWHGHRLRPLSTDRLILVVAYGRGSTHSIRNQATEEAWTLTLGRRRIGSWRYLLNARCVGRCEWRWFRFVEDDASTSWHPWRMRHTAGSWSDLSRFVRAGQFCVSRVDLLCRIQGAEQQTVHGLQLRKKMTITTQVWKMLRGSLILHQMKCPIWPSWQWLPTSSQGRRRLLVSWSSRRSFRHSSPTA